MKYVIAKFTAEKGYFFYPKPGSAPNKQIDGTGFKFFARVNSTYTAKPFDTQAEVIDTANRLRNAVLFLPFIDTQV